MSTSQETLNYCRAPENWELMTTSLVLTPYPGKATRVPLVTMMRSNSHSQLISSPDDILRIRIHFCSQRYASAAMS